MNAVAARPELELHGLVVLRDGARVLEQYWAPYVADDRALVYSASKTFTASAIALAIAEGRFALDDRIVDLLPEAQGMLAAAGGVDDMRSDASAAEGAGVLTTGAAAAGGVDEAVTQLTVHHVLSMSTGHDADVLEQFDHTAPQDWARSFLSTPPQTPVGSRHVYNNGASWLLGELVREHSGEDLLDYLRPRLLAPLGIDATWDRDALGRCLGWSGIHVRTRDLASMGELYRCDGVWQGQRLLPEGWVERATVAQIPTAEPNPDWDFGYGYQLWLGREGYRLDGAFGQFSLVLPGRGLVVAITSAQSCTQLLLDLVWDVLLPELEAQTVPEPDEGPAATLAVPTDAGLGTAWSTQGTPRVDATLVTSTDEQANLPDLSDLHAQRHGDGFRVGFTTDGHPVELTAGSGTWVRQQVTIGDVAVPVAAAAGSNPDGALDVRLVFTDSPHTLYLRVSGASAGMAWGTTPLQGGDLARLVAR